MHVSLQRFGSVQFGLGWVRFGWGLALVLVKGGLGSGVWGFGFGFPRLTVGNIVAAITFITSQRATSPG